jgi:hypothetical protein
MKAKNVLIQLVLLAMTASFGLAQSGAAYNNGTSNSSQQNQQNQQPAPPPQDSQNSGSGTAYNSGTQNGSQQNSQPVYSQNSQQSSQTTYSQQNCQQSNSQNGSQNNSQNCYPMANQIVPSGTQISVRTDTAIPAKPSANSTFTATVSSDVMASNGQVVIPRGTPAQLVAVPTPDGKDTALDLTSVMFNGTPYNLTANTTTAGSTGGIGANTRTAKYVGGGALVGTVLGAIFGGAKGAAIGALAGAGAGAGAQVYTGRDKQIPAETVLNFKLAQDLTLVPGQNP